MPRQARQFEVGSIYHILNRGYEKRTIYLEDRDFVRFIESLYYFNQKDSIKLRDELKYTGRTCVFQRLVDVLAFVIMPNHYHLLLREIQPNGIQAFMQKLGNGYTGYFNTKYNRIGVGGIFQGRYKHVYIKDEIQWGNIFSYIHTNPIELIEPRWKDFYVGDKKRAMSSLESYRWSSYHDYVGSSIFPGVVQTELFTDYFGGRKGCQKAIEDWINYKAENTQVRPVY